MQTMAPLSAQLLQKRLAAGDNSETDIGDSSRHTQLNATWTSMGKKYHEEAETMGAVRPRSVHEIVARARQTVASPMSSPIEQCCSSNLSTFYRRSTSFRVRCREEHSGRRQAS